MNEPARSIKPRTPRKKKKDLREERTAEKADALFLTYVQMGEDRSLHGLGDFVRSMGAEISDKTLERWSARFDWQSRLLKFQAEAEKKRALDGVDALAEMNSRHIRLNQALGNLAAAGINRFQDILQRSQQNGRRGSLVMDYGDIISLISQSQRGERLARGQATSRAEVIVEVLSPVVKEIMAVFLAVNVITSDPPETQERRQAEFIKRADAVLAGYYDTATKQISNKD